MSDKPKGPPFIIDRIEARADTGVNMAKLYEDDIVRWAQGQAELLRLRAAGRMENEAQLDWNNLAAEIEDVGKSLTASVKSHLVQMMAHRLKVMAWPNAPHVPHWTAEADEHRDQTIDRYAPSMAQLIDMDELYRRALRKVPPDIDGMPPQQKLPDTSPWSLIDLLQQ